MANYSFEAKHNYFANLRDEHKFVSIWSLYDVENIDREVNFEGCQSMSYVNHWGMPVEVELPSGKCTWLDLWKAADECIKTSGDQHHIFVEGFTSKDGKLELITGS